MASLDQHASGVWRVRFRYGGRQFFRSLDTTDEKSALSGKATVEETLGLLKRGVLTMPPDVVSADDVGRWVVSGGKSWKNPSIPATVTLKAAVESYFNDLPEGAKEGTTLATERIHLAHVQDVLGSGKSVRGLGAVEVQSYISKRSKSVEPVTIRKEVQTLCQLWSYCRGRGWTDIDFPRGQVTFPRDSAEKPPFQTWEEIERAIREGGSEDLWDNLFLREKEVLELLGYVRKSAEHPFILPMFAIAALRGARRSEICRSERADWNLDRKVALIRERKRVRGSAGSFRRIDLPDLLVEIMREWFDVHPGGRSTLCTPPSLSRSKSKSNEPRPITVDMATDHFKRTLDGSKWSVVRGFHTLRHSFISVKAMQGVNQGLINIWAGHQTESESRRYRHLFPEEIRNAVENEFNGATLATLGK